MMEPVKEFVASFEFEDPVETLESLFFILNRLLQQLCANLISGSFATNELRLTIGLEVRQLQTDGNKDGRWRREIDVVIGTQLVTKGYHFPNLTLVGVVDADLGLAGGDLRAAERSFQQIQQVAGRAGRGDKPGRVFVQTHDPDAPVIAALVSGDGAGF